MRPRCAWEWARTVHAYVAETGPAGGAPGVDVVFLDARGRVLKLVRRAHPGAATRDLAAFRGILLALWTARRLGARTVIVHSDNAAIVKQIAGELDVTPALVGPYLEVRALLHAYRSARVQSDDQEKLHEALAAAAEPHGQDPNELLDDLPLWARAAAGGGPAAHATPHRN